MRRGHPRTAGGRERPSLGRKDGAQEAGSGIQDVVEDGRRDTTKERS